MPRTDSPSHLLFLALLASSLSAQVVSPPEIRSPELRELQQKHLAELKSVGVAITAHQFPWPFYFSRTLDLNEEQQKRRDQRSIQFARYGHQTVVQITGNYYASYSAELMKREERARRTFSDVMLPILEAEVPQLKDEPNVQGFALEISHHVRKKVLGVNAEHPENVVLVLPKAAALRLVAAADETARAVALEEGSFFVNGEAVTLWAAANPDPPAESASTPAPAPAPRAEPRRAQAVLPAAAPPPQPAPPEPSAGDLKTLQSSYQPSLDKLAKELDATAHFVGYAPPTFINFHKAAYLQLSLTTTIQAPDPSARYRAAAQAFEDHIAHLVRPVLAYFKDDPKFAGIDFSTTIKPAGQAVEYIFALPDLRCYEQYDCTGQQLINSGFVLINGERVSLDLQSAER